MKGERKTYRIYVCPTHGHVPSPYFKWPERIYKHDGCKQTLEQVEVVPLREVKSA